MNSLPTIRIPKMLCIWISRCVPVVVLLALSNGSASAQQQLSISGNATLTIATALPGSQPAAVQHVATRIRIRRQAGAITKVTVRTSCAGQKFSLKTLSFQNEDGVPAPEVTLVHNGPAADFLVNIPAGGGQFWTDIRYTASTTYAQGTGTDLHTVTYTLVAQ